MQRKTSEEIDQQYKRRPTKTQHRYKPRSERATIETLKNVRCVTDIRFNSEMTYLTNDDRLLESASVLSRLLTSYF